MAKRVTLARQSLLMTECFGLVLIALFLCNALYAQNDRFPNVAASSSLPQGDGLAAKFKADAGIAAHPAVIFADDFESGELENRWDSSITPQALSFSDSSDPICGKRSLKVEARPAENTGGGLTQWFESADRVFVRFYMRIDPDCGYISHCVTLRANKGLSGEDKWTGFGGAGNKPEGDRRFSTGLDPVGEWGRWPAPGKWYFYSYWHEMQVSRDEKYWGNWFIPESQENIPTDRWICAEFMLKHNTPGQADGEQAFWIDGLLMGHWKGINWRTTESLKANALSLELYVSDSGTAKNPVNIVYFDNLVIAREYIGPAK